jgi:hypothetical protein
METELIQRELLVQLLQLQDEENISDEGINFTDSTTHTQNCYKCDRVTSLEIRISFLSSKASRTSF